MAVKFTSVKCPECGASLPIEEGREKMFCSYCGVPVIMTNENEHIYRHIDEAKIMQTEADRAIQLKKMEIIERKRAAGEKTKKIKIIVSIVMGIVGVLLMLLGAGMGSLVGLLVLEGIMWIWIMNDGKEDELDLGDKIKVPSGISDYEKKSYATVEAIFTSAGFTNIKCIPLHDLTTGWLKKPNTVDSITVAGNAVSSGGRKFPPDATVVISYHSFSSDKGEG